MMKNKYALVGIALVFILIGGVFLARVVRPVKTIADAPGVSGKSKGPAGAPVQIIEYSDFECPACQKAAEFVSEIFKAYPGKIHFTFKHYPLQSHKWSPIAHAAAECAAIQNSFWEYHDMLYFNQPEWTVSSNPTEYFFRFAKDLGMDLDSLAVCIESSKIKSAVLSDRRQGEALQIKATPTFFINGERVVGPLEFKIKADRMVRKILGLPVVGSAAPESAESLMTHQDHSHPH